MQSQLHRELLPCHVRVMRCFRNYRVVFPFRTQRRHMTTRIVALARCRTRMSMPSLVMPRCFNGACDVGLQR
jgi:hypothetical protein